ncbi:hypothetical protein MIND_01159400 [Mycena indigotica]|uniref:Uncharacterized protein n=1 Tax=Mycena indigotica TaxID=2126181 RepID=A0A8H6S789_9AGAR|nr:uncharacterized protein MIND_01159400 [Mycena indigotica]KAF7292615.1 hypothetical protein MIND_01159400 [Mycena indigotica]
MQALPTTLLLTCMTRQEDNLGGENFELSLRNGPTAYHTAEPIHLLVVGGGGVGKSRLLRHALQFGIENKMTSYPPASARSWSAIPGVSSPLQPGVVAHELSLCIRVPVDSSRKIAIHPAELEFLRRQRRPVIVIFTQFDGLVYRVDEMMNLSDAEESPEQSALQQVEELFYKTCQQPLADIKPSVSFVRTSRLDQDELTITEAENLQGLLTATRYLSLEYIERRSAEIPGRKQQAAERIQMAIAMAMEVYSSAVLSCISLSSLVTILGKLHRDTTRAWDFNDPFVVGTDAGWDMMLDRLQKRDSPEIISEVQALSSAQSVLHWDSEACQTSWLSWLDRYQIILGLAFGASVTATLGRVAALLAVVFWLGQIAIRLKRRLPETTRTFLEYSIHLILLVDRISYDTSTSPARPLSEMDFERAISEYKESEAAAQVQSAVQRFIDDGSTSLWRMLRGWTGGRAEELMQGLLLKWRTEADRGAMSTDIRHQL